MSLLECNGSYLPGLVLLSSIVSSHHL